MQLCDWVQVWEANLVLYVGNCYGSGFAKFGWGWPGYNDGFYNNTCVFRTSYESTCGRDKSFKIGGNAVYSKDGTLDVCGNISFAAWQAAGHDTKTVLGAWPDDATLVRQARALLGF